MLKCYLLGKLLAIIQISLHFFRGGELFTYLQHELRFQCTTQKISSQLCLSLIRSKMQNSIPPKHSIIEVDWGKEFGWVKCVVLSNVDKKGYCKCSGDEPRQWKLKLLFQSSDSETDKPSVKWRYFNGKRKHSHENEDVAELLLRLQHRAPENSTQITEPRVGKPPKKNLKTTTLSNTTKLSFHELQIENMTRTFEQLIQLIPEDSFTPMNLGGKLEEAGFGVLQSNDRIVGSGESIACLMNKEGEMYSLFKTVYYSMIDTYPHDKKCRFLTRPSVLITISNNQIVGKPHTDTYNIDDVDNMLWCGYFTKSKGYLREKYKFLHLLGRTVSTSFEPFTFDAKHEFHQVCFDEQAPQDSLRISVIFYHNGRKPHHERILCVNV